MYFKNKANPKNHITKKRQTLNPFRSFGKGFAYWNLDVFFGIWNFLKQQ